MSASESPADRVVADTVVVSYFLAVDAFDLLRELLGGVVYVPRAVFDPEESPKLVDEAVSELGAGLRLHRRRVEDDSVPPVLRERSQSALPQFERLPVLAASGELVALDLTGMELSTFAELRDPGYVKQFGLVAGLGRGEAAALAIALERGYGFATDDQDAIRVIDTIAAERSVLRIRALLVLAVERRLISIDRARELHKAMVAAGFWDRGAI